MTTNIDPKASAVAARESAEREMDEARSEAQQWRVEVAGLNFALSQARAELEGVRALLRRARPAVSADGDRPLIMDIDAALAGERKG